jgi:hypothetical protein
VTRIRRLPRTAPEPAICRATHRGTSRADGNSTHGSWGSKRPQPDSHAVEAGTACGEESILLARMGVGDEAPRCGVDGLQRSCGSEVVGTILEPHNQASSRSVEDDASTIAVVGEMDCWFQVDARATQHCDELGVEVWVDSTRRRESRSGGQGIPAAVLPACGRGVAAALDQEVQDNEDQGQGNDRETDIHHVPPCCGGLLNITCFVVAAPDDHPGCPPVRFALVASDPKHRSPSSWRLDVHPPRYSGHTILAIRF